MDCKDCKCYVFPRNIEECKKPHGAYEICFCCGMAYCPNYIEYVDYVPKKVRETTFCHKEIQEFYPICFNCYKEKINNKGE